MTPLSKLIDSATGSDVPIGDVLRQLKVMAVRCESSLIINWTNDELDGYPDWTLLPGYRGPLETTVYGDFSGPFSSIVTKVEIPSTSLPEEMRVPTLFKVYVSQSVSEIQHLLYSSGDDRTDLHVPWAPEITNRVNWLIQHGKVTLIPMHGLSTVYRTLSTWTLKGILETVRNRVLDIGLAIERTDARLGWDERLLISEVVSADALDAIFREYFAAPVKASDTDDRSGE